MRSSGDRRFSLLYFANGKEQDRLLGFRVLDGYELVHPFGWVKVLRDPYGTNLDNKQYLETLLKSAVITSVVFHRHIIQLFMKGTNHLYPYNEI